MSDETSVQEAAHAPQHIAGQEPDARTLRDAATLLFEEAETVAVCLRCDRTAAWKSDERKFTLHNTAGKLRAFALRLDAVSLDSATDSTPTPPESAP